VPRPPPEQFDYRIIQVKSKAARGNPNRWKAFRKDDAVKRRFLSTLHIAAARFAVARGYPEYSGSRFMSIDLAVHIWTIGADEKSVLMGRCGLASEFATLVARELASLYDTVMDEI